MFRQNSVVSHNLDGSILNYNPKLLVGFNPLHQSRTQATAIQFRIVVELLLNIFRGIIDATLFQRRILPGLKYLKQRLLGLQFGVVIPKKVDFPQCTVVAGLQKRPCGAVKHNS